MIKQSSAIASDPWELLQGIFEFVGGYEKLQQLSPIISVFGSSKEQKKLEYLTLGEEIGFKLSSAGFTVATGGGPGIMEAVNRGAYRGNSLSMGLQMELDKHNEFQDISLNFKNVFIRKLMLIKYSLAYIFLPGGFGTMDELSDVLALTQAQKIKKHPIILVCSDFWQDLLKWMQKKMLQQKLISIKDRQLITMVNTASEVMRIINTIKRRRPNN